MVLYGAERRKTEARGISAEKIKCQRQEKWRLIKGEGRGDVGGGGSVARLLESYVLRCTLRYVM